MVAESWFSSLWRSRRDAAEPGKQAIGVLAFEVASLMSKVVHLWQCLSDKQVIRLREELMNSVGIRKLVSDDDDYIVGLACAEMIENLGFVARSVARLGKRCVDPVLQRFEHVFDDLVKNDADPYGWAFTGKKMDTKIRKMEKYIVLCANLYQEMEVLAELEQSLRRMPGSEERNRASLLEFQKKVLFQRQEVKNLQQISLWQKTYDYTVLLLARSLFTIFGRIKHVFGINQLVDVGGQDSKIMGSENLTRSYSISATVHPSENNLARFRSGPLERLITQSGPLSGVNKTNHRQWPTRDHSSTLSGKPPRLKAKRLTPIGPFKGCMMVGKDSPVLESCMPLNSGHLRSYGVYSGNLNRTKDNNAETPACGNMRYNTISIFSSKHSLLNAPPSTLGASALALQYANVIIVIEKLVATPHLISPDARNDLYNMLPSSIRSGLRSRLKSYKNLASYVYDTVLAGEWSEALARILEWLAPLAHNMIRWQSERNFEQQNLVSRTYVLLVQTLYYANQAKTEAAITELLVGLNYVWRFGRELNERALLECASSGTFDDYLDPK